MLVSMSKMTKNILLIVQWEGDECTNDMCELHLGDHVIYAETYSGIFGK